jgi:hypothetical protein
MTDEKLVQPVWLNARQLGALDALASGFEQVRAFETGAMAYG